MEIDQMLALISRGKQNVPDLKLFSTNYWQNASNQYFSNDGTDITEEVQEAIDYLADEGVLPDDFDASDTSPENIEALNGYIAEEFDDLVIDPNIFVFLVRSWKERTGHEMLLGKY